MTIIDGILHEIVEDIKKRFGLHIPLENVEIIEDDVPSSNSFTDTIRFTGTSLLYHKHVDFSDLFSKAVVAREIMQYALPASISDERARRDLAYEYGRQVLSKNEKDHWTEIWVRESPDEQLPSGIRYRPRVFFNLLWNLGREQALDGLVRRLAKMERHGIRLEIQDWAYFLIRYSTEYEQPINSTEIAIIDTLVREPYASIETVNKRTGITKKWISETRRILKEKEQLYEYEFVSYAKIGIRVFQVALTPERTGITDCWYLLKGCPFIFSRASLLTRGKGVLATLCIPDNPRNLAYLNMMKETAARDGVNAFVFERYKASNNLNLTDYVPSLGKWEIDWDSIRMEASMMQRDALAKIYPEMTFSEFSDVRNLDRIDIKILSEFERGNKTIRQLQRVLGLRISTIANRMRRLRTENVIVKRYEVHHIGLVEECIVYTTDKNAGECVSALGLRLPRTFIDYDKDENLFMRIRLPKGGIYAFSIAVEPIEPYPSIQLVGNRIWGHWRLVDWLDFWDEKLGKWKPLKEKPASWLESMESYR